MGKKTKIDWCDSSWNPVTGCNHGCKYCYARGISERFGGHLATLSGKPSQPDAKEWEFQRETNHVLDEPMLHAGKKMPYPFDFDPTFHRYKLDEPQKWTKPRNIFVVSMGDLFGNWAPMDWKIEVLLACAKAPQHRYLFLTKNPIGYCLCGTEKHPVKDLPVSSNADELYTDNMWLGVTYTGRERLPGTTFDPADWRSRNGIGTNFWYLWRMSGAIFPFTRNKFLSVEPIACDITEVEDERNPGERLLDKFIYGEDRPFRTYGIFKWVIVGAETGNRKDRIVPRKEWIDKLAALCARSGVPIFMKESLRGLMGDDFKQEFPWEV